MMLRSSLRRVARRLPTGAQLLLRRIRSAALRRNDWAASVKQLRHQEQTYVDETARTNRMLPERKRLVVFAPQQVPPWLEISYTLAAALRLRGHAVRGILCDGLLPLCEMNLGVIDRPPCGVCVGWLARYEDAFGFRFSRGTHLISKEDRDDAEELVARIPGDELKAFVVDHVGVGRLAWRELQRYYRGYVFNPSADQAYRPWLVSAILLVRLAGRLLDHERPDIVVASSGRTLPTACLSEVARLRGIRVVTWDTEPSHSDGLVFSHDHSAVEIPLDEAWAEASRRPLTAGQVEKLREFLGRWARSEITPFPYNPAPLDDQQAIRSQLALRPGSPTVVAYANSTWDMAAVDRDVGFASMFEWLFSLVEYGIAHPEIDLVVRAHPAEVKVPPDLRSRTPVAPEIRRRYGPLPGNIKLVEGDNPVSSYTLADMAQVVMIYASRIGLEVAVRGKRPWLAGDMTYRGKGFTRDLASKEEMVRLLNAGTFEETLSADEIEMAERFAYLWFFRYIVRLPLVRPPAGSFALKTFRELAPGGHPVIDALCEALVTGRPFIDLNFAPVPPHVDG